MEGNARPQADALLASLEQEESSTLHGRLKIFLGMAAGVGKTYAMLLEAQRLRREGVDIVIGVINTHGRQETAALLEGLEVIPLREMPYKGLTLPELDLDAIIKRHPHFVLVDELAHTNAPGSRHEKRWQDVLELLNNGINVYTALNVQHIESLKDTVEAIAGIPIRETVPDSVIDAAASIEIIDLTTDELLQRLKEGKVYLGEQPRIAAEHFFLPDRLTALREIILRYAAEKVDHDLRGMSSVVGHAEGWKLRERFLVALAATSEARRLIRVARRLAATIHAPWIVLHVDDGTPLTTEEQTLLSKNLNLARDLGAEVLSICDPYIPEAVERIARQKGVTQVIIGRCGRRPWWRFWSHEPLVERLAAACPDIDIHVIRQETLPMGQRRQPRPKTPWYVYAMALGALAVTTFIGELVEPVIDYKGVGTLYLLLVLLASMWMRAGIVAWTAILSGVAWDYFFIPPKNAFVIARQEDLMMLLLYVIAAVVGSVWISRVVRHRQLLLRRERATTALHEIMRTLANASTVAMHDVLQLVCVRLELVLDGSCEVLLRGKGGALDMSRSTFLLNDRRECDVASWAYVNGAEAGWCTATLGEAQGLYLPLKGLHGQVGVLCFRPKEPLKLLTVEELDLLYTVAQQLASYLERVFAA